MVITGHSLGAGTACVIGLLLLDEDIAPNFRVFALAPPCVTSECFNDIIGDRIVTCALGDDPVPRSSIGSFHDIVDAVIEFERRDTD